NRTFESPVYGDDCNWNKVIEFTVTDICGNDYPPFKVILNGRDQTAPVFQDECQAPEDIEFSCPENATISLKVGDKISPFDSWTVADKEVAPVGDCVYDCVGLQNITLHVVSITNAKTTCSNEITVTFEAEDLCKNISKTTYTRVFNAVDTTKPVTPQPPADVELQCADDVPAPIELTAVDNCSGDITVLPTEERRDGDCENNFTIIRTWKFTDNCGNSSSVSQTIVVNDTTDPTIDTAAKDKTVECIAAVSEQVWINEFHYDNSGADEGEFVEVAANFDASAYQIVLYNGSGGAMYNTLGLVFASNSNGINYYTASGSSIQNGGSNPDGIALVNGSDVIEFISYEGSFTATDGPANGMLSTDVGVLEASSTPIGHSLQLIGTGTKRSDFTWSGPIANTSGVQNTGQTVSSPPVGNPNQDDLEAWLAANGGAAASDNCSGVTWTNDFDALSRGDCPGTGSVTVTFTATDSCGNSSDTVATFTIEDKTKPVLDEAPADVTVACLDEVPDMVSLNWTDNCDTGGSVQGVDGQLEGTSCNGTITRTWNVSDACGNPAETRTQIITIKDDVNPTASNPQDINVECSADVPDPDTAVVTDEADNCGTPKVTHVSDVSDNQSCPETITRTYKVEDTCGNSIEVTQKIIIKDVTNPVLAAAPQDVTVDCIDDVPEMTSLDWTDNCDAGGSVEGVDGDLVGTDCDGTITRTWNVKDACGNDAITRTQIITIKDSTNPTASNPADINVECVADVPGQDPSVVTDEADNCSTPTVTWVKDVSDNLSCPETITRTYKVEDACGNSIEVEQKIIIKDVTAPVIVDIEDYALETCNENWPDLKTTWTDNCGVNGQTSGDVDGIPGEPSAVVDCIQTLVYTFSVTDDCGNNTQTTTTVSRIIDVEDPILVGVPKSEIVECDAIPDPPSVTATDGCTDNMQVEFEELSNTVVDGCGEIVRKWTATDDCGNTASATQTITVVDNTPPVITNCPDDVDFGEVTETPEFSEVGDIIATDNCDPSPEVTFDDTDDSVYVPGEDVSEAGTYKFTCQTGPNTFDFLTFVWDGTFTNVGVSGPQANYTPIVTGQGTYTLTFEEGIDNPNTAPVEALNDWVLRLDGILIALKNSQNNDEYPDCDANWIETDYLQNTLNCSILRVECLGGSTDGVTYYTKIRTFTATDNCGNESNTCIVIYDWSIVDAQQAPQAPEKDEESLSIDFVAYPVPFNSDVTVKYNFEFDTDVIIEIYDTKGLLVQRQVNKAYKAGSEVILPMTIDGADQLYYVKIITNRGEVTKKIVSSNTNKQ
ncbi:hypothetical protein U0L90_09790, partial [Flavobacteriaceae sp. LMIT009]